MKRKLLLLILASGMAVFVLTGCGNTKTIGEDMPVSEENVKETTDYCIAVAASGFDNALLLVTYSDGEGGTYVEETGSYVWFGGPGMNIGQMMEDWDIISLEAVCEGQELLGWVAYEQVVEVDENGFEKDTSVKLFDGKVFTTEEMMVQELPEGDITFNSVWDLICGECEERKVCQIYYIDDAVYYVCDDCYKEFAYAMGLE